MKIWILLFSLSVLCLSAGCTTPGQAYVKQHPELTEAQRKIFRDGQITEGDDVKGLTKEQIRIAMHSDPDQYDRFDGMEAWVYIKPPLGATLDELRSGAAGLPVGSSNSASTEKMDRRGKRTTVIFDGDRAVRATVTVIMPDSAEADVFRPH
jgi:hypothetical protein